MQQWLNRIQSSRTAASRTAPAAPAATPRLYARRQQRQPLTVRAFVSDDKNWHKVGLKHVIQAQQFGRDAINVIFEEAARMEKVRLAQPAHEPAMHAPP